MKKADPRFTPVQIHRLADQGSSCVADRVASEEPLEIRLGYTDARKGRIHRSVAITMRTPGDDAALVTGFLFSESIIGGIDDIDFLDLETPNVARVELREDVIFELQRLERHFYTTSSCGVCGKASLESLSTAGFNALLQNTFLMPATVLQDLPGQLQQQQELFGLTGGNHATALFDAEGHISLVTEDVGRHNAMDKLVGRLLQSRQLPLHEHGLLVSGRASFELLQKALAAGCPLLAAIGAPSSLAVELAQEFNITLVGFLNARGMNIYHGHDNIGQTS